MILLVLAAAAAASNSFDPSATAPTPAALAEAVARFTRRPLDAADVRHIQCERFEEEPTEFACDWQQRLGHRWIGYSSYLAIDAHGWALIDEPNRK